MNSNNSVYVRMMVDVLKRKEKILQQILEQTKEQEVILKQEDVDYDRFQELLDEKGRQIDELNQIDEGFDALFKKVEKEITVHKKNYLTEIVAMQKFLRYRIWACGFRHWKRRIVSVSKSILRQSASRYMIIM